MATAAPTILITPRSLTAHHHVALHALEERGYQVRLGPAGQTPSEEQLHDLLPGCVGWLAGVEPVSESVIVSASKTLRVISRNGVGTDNLPLDTCHKLGIDVRRAIGANAQAVAELTLGLMLAGLRQIPFSDSALKGGNWERRSGLELHGATIGIIGIGEIGGKVAQIASKLDATVLWDDPFVDQCDNSCENSHRVARSEIFQRSQILTLHCPAQADNLPIVDAEVLSEMRSDAVLINTARAGLVDENAVLAALDEGRLGCYATDVFDREPPGLTRLIASNRVIATPHIGGFTSQSVHNSTTKAVNNLLDGLEESLKNGTRDSDNLAVKIDG